jgi:toxin ParE1/3/4
MSAKPIVPRHLALRDVEDAIDHDRREAGADIAIGFIDALKACCRWIAGHPATGSPRYAHELDLPGLRHRSLNRFPYLVFSIERADHIDVWRVLDARRDIPDWLAGSDAP